MNTRLLKLAITCLAVGASVYLFVRPAPVWFVPSAVHLPLFADSWLAAVGGSLPAAAHVLALSLLTAPLLGANARAATIAAAIWTAVNVAFEVGQHASVTPLLLTLLPTTPDTFGPLTALRAYFLNGVFDPLDIAGALAGGAIARRLIARSNEEISHAPA